MTTPAIPEGFTPWNGGANPAPGKRVIVLFGDGARSIATASSWFGQRNWKQRHSAAKYNIIAYRVVGDTE